MKSLILYSALVIGAYFMMPIIEGVIEFNRGEAK